jgi:hypothetical protein
MPVNDTIQLRKGSYSEWVSANPVLATGEAGYDLTNSILKIGDGTNTWIDLPLTASSDLYAYVKNTTTGTLYKGQAVYINGAVGNNPTLALAVASGESTSSKTLGLLKQNLNINEFGYVVTEGILEGINTDSASADGDSIWLSPTVPGGVVYGTANKPTAPNHLVFLGYVLRKQLNNGKIYIKVQNGFELGELHNVATNGTSDGSFLQYNSASGLWLASNSGNFSSLSLNGTGVSISGHNHTINIGTGDVSQISFNTNQVLNIISSGGININFNDSTNTITISPPTAVTGFEELTTTKNTFSTSPNYRVGTLSVYYNGLKLINGQDYTATDGSSFILAESGVQGDVIEWAGTT